MPGDDGLCLEEDRERGFKKEKKKIDYIILEMKKLITNTMTYMYEKSCKES